MPVTETTKKALEFVRKATDSPAGYATAIELAGFMWPDSPKWHSTKNCGASNTGVRGGGMYRPAQGLLGKLKKAGLVTHHHRSHHVSFWVITREGREALVAQKG